jgi:predicted MPP superfamily phosphohydrolase
VFLLFVFVVSSLMHLYLIGRLRVLWALMRTAHARRAAAIALPALWLAFPVSSLAWNAAPAAAFIVQLAGALWLGTIFLVFSCTLFADVATAARWFFLRLPGTRTPGSAGQAVAPVPIPASVRLRLAGAAAGAVLALVAMVQGARGPVVRDVDVQVPGLRPSLDGLVIVQITDLHLGELLGAGWLEARLRQVESLHPDLVAVTGDILNDPNHVRPLAPLFRRLHPPLGVWAVSGNHEFFAGLDRSLKVFADAGFSVLRDAAVEVAPGLRFAGVDDLTARRQEGPPEPFVERALAGRYDGATVFLCHTPWAAERAAALGAGLMLSGHTHDGQIWPLRYLVRLLYPRITGRYQVGRMTLLVSRGTGFWGPPMRLFYPSEILRITLHPA